VHLLLQGLVKRGAQAGGGMGAQGGWWGCGSACLQGQVVQEEQGGTGRSKRTPSGLRRKRAKPGWSREAWWVHQVSNLLAIQILLHVLAFCMPLVEL
jgi:hypothetical protein